MKYGTEVPIGDGPCTDCGQGNPFIWWADNVFWNAVCRAPDSGPEPTLCLACFVKRVYAAGYQPQSFRVIPEWPWLQQGVLDGNQQDAGPATKGSGDVPPTAQDDSGDKKLPSVVATNPPTGFRRFPPFAPSRIVGGPDSLVKPQYDTAPVTPPSTPDGFMGGVGYNDPTPPNTERQWRKDKANGIGLASLVIDGRHWSLPEEAVDHILAREQDSRSACEHEVEEWARHGWTPIYRCFKCGAFRYREQWYLPALNTKAGEA